MSEEIATPPPIASDEAVAHAAAWEKYQEELEQFKRETLAALENRKSSEQEYDKLIVYLAGGGLVLTIGFVKDLLQLSKSNYLGWLLACWALFALCLLTNLLSHYLAKQAFDSYLREDAAKLLHRKRQRVEIANVICFAFVAGGTLAFVAFVFLNLLRHAR
ncbi:hypothetical protein [Hymenobacter sp. GOD-10R]|jgi:hypothetical protein|uniref:hypothetical protein n=1 Tax=Hymenobacter sp. GOD-10R TaxID=3093922 RepID=UPI002D778EA5|nr:hypothetical protein [Hymenobacter sp. GOD-10R]WRQ31454.1 hypothetical protein SD425_26625 [Hymenobacter sp. GOD-10R]